MMETICMLQQQLPTGIISNGNYFPEKKRTSKHCFKLYSLDPQRQRTKTLFYVVAPNLVPTYFSFPICLLPQSKEPFLAFHLNGAGGTTERPIKHRIWIHVKHPSETAVSSIRGFVRTLTFYGAYQFFCDWTEHLCQPFSDRSLSASICCGTYYLYAKFPKCPQVGDPGYTIYPNQQGKRFHIHKNVTAIATGW